MWYLIYIRWCCTYMISTESGYHFQLSRPWPLGGAVHTRCVHNLVSLSLSSHSNLLWWLQLCVAEPFAWRTLFSTQCGWLLVPWWMDCSTGSSLGCSYTSLCVTEARPFRLSPSGSRWGCTVTGGVRSQIIVWPVFSHHSLDYGCCFGFYWGFFWLSLALVNNPLELLGHLWAV